MKGGDWVSYTKVKVVQNMGDVVIPNRFNKFKEHNQKYKMQIKDLKISNNSEDDTNKEELDAGYQFGGKASKKKTRFGTST